VDQGDEPRSFRYRLIPSGAIINRDENKKGGREAALSLARSDYVHAPSVPAFAAA
jgi:hypothetical protein